MNWGLRIGALIGLAVAGVVLFQVIGSSDPAVPQLWVSDSGDLHQVYGGEKPDSTNMVFEDVDTIGFIAWRSEGSATKQGELSMKSVVAIDGRLLASVILDNGDGALIELFEDRSEARTIFRKDDAMNVVVVDEWVSIGANEDCYRGKIDKLATGRVYRGDTCTVSSIGEFAGREKVGNESIFSVFDAEGQLVMTEEDHNPIGAKQGFYFFTVDFDDTNARVFDVRTGDVVVGNPASSDDREDDEAPVESTLIGNLIGLGFAVQHGPDIYLFSEGATNYRVFTPAPGGDGKAVAVFRDKGMLLRYRDEDDKTTVYLWNYDEEQPTIVFSGDERVMSMDMLGDEILLAKAQLPDDDEVDARYRLVATTGETERVLHEGEGFVNLRVIGDHVGITEEIEDGDEKRMTFVSKNGNDVFASRYYEDIRWSGNDGDLTYIVGVDNGSQMPLRADFGAGEVTELEEIDAAWSYYLNEREFLVTDRVPGSTSTTYVYGAEEYYPIDEIVGYSVYPAYFDITLTGG